MSIDFWGGAGVGVGVGVWVGGCVWGGGGVPEVAMDMPQVATGSLLTLGRR